jgi:hypothetical protein
MSRKSSLESVVQPMTGPERRQTPRTTMERHAYINIEPNNGGIVLNVSSGGLCFHSFDPVKRNGTIRFWFSDHNQRIDAEAELAWTDETQKGGLRFTALPPEAQEQIRNWMNQPAIPLVSEGISTSSVLAPRVFPSPMALRPDARADSVFGPLVVVPPEARVAVPLKGFSGGLATGLLIAAVVAAAFLFNNYRREFGESLIRMGERFAAKPQEQAQTLAPAPLTAMPAPQTVSPPLQVVSAAPQKIVPPQVVSPVPQAVVSPPQMPSAAPKPVSLTPLPPAVPQPEKLLPQPLANPDKPQPTKLEPAQPVAATPDVTPTPVGNSAPKVLAAAVTPAISSPTRSVSLPATVVAPVSNLVAGKPGTVPPLAPASRPGVQAEESATANADATEEMYFEIGKFKDQGRAHDTTEKLAELGFPVTAVQKGHLWRNSYHVLVGPYGDEDKAKVTHEDLLSRGFKPRPFERGSRSFLFRSGLTLNGAQTPVGEYTISWESYVSDASVKFLHNDSVVATADGRWVKRDVKYQHDAYVYRKNMDGSRTLLEIHFGGMRQALVFGKS